MVKKRKNKGKDDRDLVKEAFILKAQQGWTTACIADYMSVSTRTIQRWLKLYENKDSTYWNGNCNRRARASRYGNDIRERVRELRRELPSRSATTIHRLLKAELGNDCPSVQTMRRYLREAGLVKERQYRDKNYIVFEREFPNDLWQVDFKGWDLVGHLGKLHLLAFIDDCSRFIVGARWYTTDRAENVMYLLKNALETHGLPNEILSDNGSQFKNVKGEANTTKYKRVLTLLGIRASFHKARHPECKGKIERWFGFVESSFMPDAMLRVERHPGLTVAGFNRLFKEWLDWYNFQHEHSSLDGVPPGKVYLEHPKRVFKPLGARVDWNPWIGRIETRVVDKQGSVSIEGRRYTLPDGYARRKVEIQRLPGRINITYEDELVISFDVPSEAGDGTCAAKTRKINKDGYLKYNRRQYKLTTKYALKIVHVVVSNDEKELMVYEGDVLITKIDVTAGKSY